MKVCRMLPHAGYTVMIWQYIVLFYNTVINTGVCISNSLLSVRVLILKNKVLYTNSLQAHYFMSPVVALMTGLRVR